YEACRTNLSCRRTKVWRSTSYLSIYRKYKLMEETMKKALINVDYTYDFVAEDGKLTCRAPRQNSAKAIVSITKEFLNQGELVAFGIDAHEENDTYHPATATYPPHNIKGTSGMELYGDLKTLYEMHQDDASVFYFEKTRFSAFAGTNLELKLRERGINEVHL